MPHKHLKIHIEEMQKHPQQFFYRITQKRCNPSLGCTVCITPKHSYVMLAFGFPPFFRHSAVILFIFILFPLCVKFHISCASALDGFYSVFELAVRVPALKLVSLSCRFCKFYVLCLHRINGRVFAAVLSAI